LDFLLELVEIHVIDVERLSTIGKNLLFDVSRRSFALALSRLAAEIHDENLKKLKEDIFFFFLIFDPCW
jgi:hypothetical protein